MASPELQKLTASEPLTLDEEFQMQESWAADEDSLVNKCIQLKNQIISFLYPNRMHIHYP